MCVNNASYDDFALIIVLSCAQHAAKIGSEQLLQKESVEDPLFAEFNPITLT